MTTGGEQLAEDALSTSGDGPQRHRHTWVEGPNGHSICEVCGSAYSPAHDLAADALSAVEYVRELSGFVGSACLVRVGEDYFAVSSVTAYSGFETLVFPADSDGEIESWGEVAGGRRMNRDEAIADLTTRYKAEGGQP